MFKVTIFTVFISIFVVSCGGSGGGSSSRPQETPAPADTTPDAFSFTAQTNAALDVNTDSNPVTISGINAAAPVQISGGLYQINGGSFSSNSSEISNGDSIVIRVVSASELSTETHATLNVGGVSATFSVTTSAEADDTPDAFSFSAQTNVPLDSVAMSNQISISGISVATAISVENGEYAINNGEYTSVAGTIKNGQSVIVRHTTSTDFLTATDSTLTIGGVTATFRSTTEAQDTTPAAFTFADQTEVALNTLIESAPITIQGFNSPTSISISGGEYAIDDNAFTSADGLISPGQSVKVRHQSGSDFNSATETTLTIGGISDTFSSETSSPDSTPDAFSFQDQFDVEPEATVTSSAITITGINYPSTISITGGLYAIGTGAFTDEPGTVQNGDSITVQHVASGEYSTVTTTSLTIGGVSDEFQSTTWPIGTGFNQASGFNDSVYELVETNDGSGDYYVGGDFTTFNTKQSGSIIRFNADGSIDENFVVNEGFSNIVRIISLASDGSGDIYVGGSFVTYNAHYSNYIIRLNNDGSVDTGFNTSGRDGGFDGAVYDISPANDGSGDIYVAGNFESYNDVASFGIVRLNSDGTIDEGFNTGTGFDGTAVQILPAPGNSGDIYVLSGASTYNGTAISRLVRLNSDGSLDTGFDTGTGFNSASSAIALADDGSQDIFVVGSFNTYNGVEQEGIVRLNSNGSIDATFQANRNLIDHNASKIVPVGDGSGDVFLAAYFAGYATEIIKLKGNGMIDTSFVQGDGSNDRIQNITMHSNGSQLFVTGNFSRFNTSNAKNIILLNMDGSMADTPALPASFDDGVYNILIADDNNTDIYAHGEFQYYRDFLGEGIVRIAPTGIEDGQFSLTETFYRIKDTALIQNGSGGLYLLVGTGGGKPDAIVRVDNHGSIDQQFTVTLDGNYSQKIIAANDGTGDLYVATQQNWGMDIIIRRYNSDGTIDTGFSPAGGFNTEGNVLEVSTMVVAPDGSGDLYVGGEFTTYNNESANNIIRLNNDGSVDSNFNIGLGFNYKVWAIAPALDDSGDLYIGGEFNKYQDEAARGIVRVHSDGSRETQFTASYFRVRTIAPALDGSEDIYIGGHLNPTHILRLKSNGTVNESFNPGTGFNQMVYSIAVCQDGSHDIIAGGNFTSYNATTVDYIARLNPDGSLND
ncbi:hypothetical protein TDB9533_01551 [Thalassocella blandensis]|nr:hypothetical protein TDB9533_01551 [Thalassocella blandensis]